MQLLLDEAQSTVENELDKVSLERLAEINPALLEELRQQAQNMLSSGNTKTQTSNSNNNGRGGSGSRDADNARPSFLTETRPPTVLQINKEWQKEWEKPALKQMDIPTLIQELTDFTSTILDEETLYTQTEATNMTATLAAAATTSFHLQTALQQLEEAQNDSSSKATAASILTTATSAASRLFHAIDIKNFTNDGVKVRDATVIATLYEVGLPFVSSADGRRFASQIELSKHLDYLFKKK